MPAFVSSPAIERAGSHRSLTVDLAASIASGVSTALNVLSRDSAVLSDDKLSAPSVSDEGDCVVLQCGTTVRFNDSQAIADRFAMLPMRDQEVLSMVLLSGMSHLEASRRLSLSVRELRSRLFQARCRLKLAMSASQPA